MRTCDRCGDETAKRKTVYTDQGKLRKLVCEKCEAILTATDDWMETELKEIIRMCDDADADTMTRRAAHIAKGVLKQIRKPKPQPRPYTQGFNKETKQVLVVLDVEDFQNALADGDKTISEADALEFMNNHSSRLVNAFLHGWAETISDLATALEFNPPKETPLP